MQAQHVLHAGFHQQPQTMDVALTCEGQDVHGCLSLISLSEPNLHKGACTDSSVRTATATATAKKKACRSRHWSCCPGRNHGISQTPVVASHERSAGHYQEHLVDFRLVEAEQLSHECVPSHDGVKQGGVPLVILCIQPGSVLDEILRHLLVMRSVCQRERTHPGRQTTARCRETAGIAIGQMAGGGGGGGGCLQGGRPSGDRGEQQCAEGFGRHRARR